MRLLNVHTHKFADFVSDAIPRYAIASHRWCPEEPTIESFERKRNTDSVGYKKIEQFCKFTREWDEDVHWLWIDTCCVDKKSSAELAEVINSMFRWYANADICFAYLFDVRPVSVGSRSVLDDLQRSVWFKRGWTLQELLAPKTVIFLNQDWEIVGHKGQHASWPTSSNLNTFVAGCTRIPEAVLSDYFKSKDLSVEERFKWMSTRVTTRVEDRAYCLLGIFDIYMPLIYGEGKKAYSRLIAEIERRRMSKASIESLRQYATPPMASLSSNDSSPNPSREVLSSGQATKSSLLTGSKEGSSLPESSIVPRENHHAPSPGDSINISYVSQIKSHNTVVDPVSTAPLDVLPQRPRTEGAGGLEMPQDPARMPTKEQSIPVQSSPIHESPSISSTKAAKGMPGRAIDSVSGTGKELSTRSSRLELLASSPVVLKKWQDLLVRWENITATWVSKLEANTEEIKDHIPNASALNRQITDLSAAGANLFHGMTELQKLDVETASSPPNEARPHSRHAPNPLGDNRQIGDVGILGEGDNRPTTQATKSGQGIKSGSGFPHASERWETLSSHWEGVTSYWIRKLQENAFNLSDSGPTKEDVENQIATLNAVGASLFHALVELQRLRANSERKLQRWFYDTRADNEKSRELQAGLVNQLKIERKGKEEDLAKLAELRQQLLVSQDESVRAWTELGRRNQESLESKKQLEANQGLQAELANVRRELAIVMDERNIARDEVARKSKKLESIVFVRTELLEQVARERALREDALRQLEMMRTWQADTSDSEILVKELHDKRQSTQRPKHDPSEAA